MQDISVQELAGEYVMLKAEIEERKARLKEIEEQITPMAVFPDGKSTANIDAGNYVLKVQKKSIYKWNQGKLNVARQDLGDEKFLSLFTFEWKPIAKKEIDVFLKHANTAVKAPVMDALTISSSTSVSVELKEVA